MTLHVDDELLPYVLGITSEDQIRAVEEHVEGCTRCTHLLTECRDEVALLAVSVDPVVAPALLREEILHALGETNRFSGAKSVIAKHLRMTRSQVETLLDDLDNPGVWRRAPQSPAWLYTLDEHPETAFLRVASGCAVTGVDHSVAGLILQGSCRDAAGHVYSVGDTLSWISATRESADFVAQAGPDLICLTYEPQRKSPRNLAANAGKSANQAVPNPK